MMLCYLFLLAKQLLVENLDKVKALLNVEEPIKGEKRTELIMALHTLHTAFDRMDTASYEYFEKSEVGVVEPKPIGE